MSGLTFKHTVSDNGLTLISTASDGVNTYVSEVVWTDIEKAQEARQRTMDTFERLAIAELDDGSGIKRTTVRKKGKRVHTPWGDFLVGYSIGGDFDTLKFPRLKVHRKNRKGMSVGWFKTVLFARDITHPTVDIPK